jgi:hypothetical protein
MLRELKLYDLCGETSPNVIELNVFFNDLFTGLSVYTQDGKPDLIFIKGDVFIMKQDLKNGYLLCRYSEFWKVLSLNFKMEYTEIQEVISYKVNTMIVEAFKAESLTPKISPTGVIHVIVEAFKAESLTPQLNQMNHVHLIEKALKNGSLTPEADISKTTTSIEESFKNGYLTHFLNLNL